MSEALQAKFNKLPADQQTTVQATLVVEAKLHNLRAGSALPEHQIERALADHRQKAYGMLSPAARQVVEGTMREHGILKLNHTPAERSFLGSLPKPGEGAAA